MIIFGIEFWLAGWSRKIRVDFFIIMVDFGGVHEIIIPIVNSWPLIVFETIKTAETLSKSNAQEMYLLV